MRGDLCEKWSELKIRRFRLAHAEGLMDWQLAERFGVTTQAAYKMRIKLKLRSQQDPLAAV